MKNSPSFPILRTVAALILLLFSVKLSAQRADSLFIPDTRNIASMPGDYSRILKANFKNNTVIGLSSTETYSSVIGFRGWSNDNSGGKAYELAFTSDQVFLRAGLTGWGSWKRLLTDENIQALPNGNVGIGTASPTKRLDIAGDGINLENTTYANQHGIIFKAGSSFISNFNYGNNGTVTTLGGNTFVGIGAGNFSMGSTATSAAQASYNTAVGVAALSRNTTGHQNTAIGYVALELNTTGDNNAALGFEALVHNTTGNNNTAIGFASMYNNTTGVNNSANGYETLYSNTSGNYNTANGYLALFNNTTANYNTAGGYMAIYKNTTGVGNTASGYQVLYENTTGSYNTANGYATLNRNTTGYNNTATGYAALFYNITGAYNVASGYMAGRYTATGSTADTASSSSVFIGANTKSLTAADNNEIVIGYNASGAGSNSVVLGNTSVIKTLLQGNVGIGTSTPQSKLAVNGTVTATQVKVTQTGWPDYVFDSTYRLPALPEVVNFIRQHKHLPELPSAKEITEKGLDLGDMQKTQMQKIEELTLYIIEEHKKNQQLQAELNALKKEFELFKKESK